MVLEYIFINYENGTVNALYKEPKSGDIISLSNNKVLELIKELSKYQNKPRFYVSNDKTIHINIENYEINIEHYQRFYKIKEFANLYKKLGIINNTKTNSKLSKKNPYLKYRIGALAATSLLIITGVASASHIKANEAIMPDTTVYEQENHDNNEINDSIDEAITEALTSIDNSVITNDVNSTKATNTRNNYGDIINKYCTKYNINTSLMEAIATQERGTHSSTRDKGGAIGLMQIEVAVWDDQTLEVFNYGTNKKETLSINESKLGDVDFNINVGCGIFQNDLKLMHNNPLAAIQCYNMGYGNMIKLLNAYSKETGMTMDEILSDVNDTGWLKYRDLISVGDDAYLEHILSYVDTDSFCSYYNVSKDSVKEILGNSKTN